MTRRTTLPRQRIYYTVFFGSFAIGEAEDRERAEEIRDAHAASNGHDPLSNWYVITPVLRKEKQGDGHA